MRHAPTLAPRTLFALLVAATLAVALPAGRAADLEVDLSRGNSPCAFTTGTATYDNIYACQSASGTLNQSSGTLSAGYVRGNLGTSTFNVTVIQALIHSTLSGDAATNGGLIKNGAGDGEWSDGVTHPVT